MFAKVIQECENENENENEEPNPNPIVRQDESTQTKETLGQGNNIRKACKVLGMKWDNEEDICELDLFRLLKENANVEDLQKGES